MPARSGRCGVDLLVSPVLTKARAWAARALPARCGQCGVDLLVSPVLTKALRGLPARSGQRGVDLLVGPVLTKARAWASRALPVLENRGMRCPEPKRPRD